MEAILKKRSRSHPTPSGKRLTPTPRDVAIVRALYEHGPLPTAHLYELTREHGIDLTRLKKRVGDLFHESDTPHSGAYLTRPWQLNPEMNFAHFVVSEATKFGEHLLADFGHLNPEAKATAGGSYPHKFMTACITASFEIAAKKTGIRYVSRAEILANSPTKSLSMPAPISYKSLVYKKPITADAIFALEYRKGRLYFLVEADLNNEPVRRTDFETTSYLRKVLQYKQAIGTGAYKSHFGIEQGLVVLTFTTNERHADNLVAMIGEELKACRFLLTTALPVFAGPFAVPAVIEDILERPYKRAGYPDFRLDQFA